MTGQASEKEIFFQAIELEGSQRDDFVSQKCGADSEIVVQRSSPTSRVRS